ncbi:CARDB domain-containing protein,subtilase family protease [Burkholderiales bacterium JOSHI_001]|nr:CARDB domain-containing protein,subtilase family protease [Burkholderiales bacterium JOSHI_001]
MRARVGGLMVALALLPATPLLQAGMLGDKSNWDQVFARRDRESREAEILVRFKDGVSAATKDAKHSAEGNRKLREFRRSGLHHVRISPAQPVQEALERYAADPNVQSAEANFVLRAQLLPNDGGMPFQWSLLNTGQNLGTPGADIKAPQAWDRGTGSAEVVVMVLDSGIDYTHPDLAANMWVNPLEIPGNGIDDDGNGYVDDVHGIDVVNGDGDPMDDNGHGTHVAGIIGAVGNNTLGITGVAWNVKLIACKVLDANGEGTVDKAVECLEYARALKARGVNIVATNNSYGEVGPTPVALGEAIAAQPDILFVAAGGNFGANNDVTDYFPGNFALPNVLSVAATDNRDGLVSFSGYGRRTVHLGAPGVDILSTAPGEAILPGTGTSQSAPHVTGVAALLKAQNPQLDLRAIRNLILTGGDPVPSLQGRTVSGRRLNAANASACSQRPLFSALKLPVAFTVGSASTVSVLSLDCGNAVGPVTGTASSGELFSLRDDGVAPDQVAGDGEFTAAWTPTQPFGHIDFASTAGSERVSTVDLTVAGVAGPSAAALGTTITVNVTVGNTSGSATPASVLNLLVSRDGIVSPDDVVLANAPVPSIGPASQVVVPVTVTLPSSLGEGIFFLAAVVDPANQVSESNESNNAASGNVMVVNRAAVDLLPGAVSGPATGTVGTAITVSATVQNQGSAASVPTTLSFYLSSDATITTGDLLLGTASINALAAGGSQAASGAVTLPAGLAAGSYTIGAIADSAGVQVESDEVNNARAGNTITVAASKVDLVFTAVGNPPAAKNGAAISLTATLKNQGTAAAPASTVRWYLSSDATITTADRVLASLNTTALAAAASRNLTVSAGIPLDVPAGTYYIGAIADPDNLVGESNDANNVRASTTKVVVSYSVDLVMTAVAGPASAVTGQNVSFTGTLKNQGVAAAGEVVVGFYLSAGSGISPSDRLIASTKVASLAGGASVAVSATAALRTDLPAGSYYIGAIADPANLVAESNNANNARVATGLISTGFGPDLVVSAVSAPATVTRGSAFAVNATVLNQGTGAIGAASDQAVITKGSTIRVGVYLSRNATITTADDLIGTATFSALGAGASLPLTLNITLPANLAAGSYYIGAIADRTRDLREAVEVNNALAGNLITVR